MSDNTKKFSGKASEYASGRPGYAQEFIDMLFGELGASADSIIADIGSGTGILTEQLLKRGCTVYAVEPNDDMRASAEKQLFGYNNFISLNATAEATTLANASIDIITVAQAFHWFDADKFKTECKRILKTNGKVFLIWNTRDVNAEINVACEKVFKKYCPHFKGFAHGQDNTQPIDSFFDGDYTRIVFDNKIVYEKSRFIDRCFSSSYSIRKGDPDYNALYAEVCEIADKFCVDGFVTVPNITEVFYSDFFN